jgi:hypothetical protein
LRRAPDNQPTENIRQVLDSAKRDLEKWEQYEVAEQRSLDRTKEIILTQQATVRQWEAYLAIRLAEEAESVEVTGL